MIHILVVNINNLKYTRDLVSDLRNQTGEFKLTIMDQGSTEEGTKEYLDSLLDSGIELDVVYNEENVDLSRLWNKFYLETSEPYLCFLNNDLRILSNFVSDIYEIFHGGSDIGCVVHITNPTRFIGEELAYVISDKKFVQGWEFTVKREAYTLIPDDLKTFGGDDYIFYNLYKNRWKVAVALSSPIIHYGRRSRKYYKGDRNEEVIAYRKYGFEKLPYGARI